MGTRLVINADDFGYFDGVTEGILDAMAAGTVTATGIMANAPGFDRWAAVLRSHHETDAGVHLNATYGEPLTTDLAALLHFNGGELPRKGRLALHLMLGRIPVAAIAREWRAQIERCIAAGLVIRFLNSHEHVHMHPSLYAVIIKLGREFRIPFVRHTTAEVSFGSGLAPALRGLALNALGKVHSPAPMTPRLLGHRPSGHLDIDYMRWTLPRLRETSSYELMCHPGRNDARAASDARLRNYHDWAGELRCLVGLEFREALRDYAIRIVRFRDLVN